MKKPVIYIHGGDSFQSKEAFLTHLRTVPLREVEASGERPKRWADTLASDLGQDFVVYAPSMPNKHNADYEEWKAWFERYLTLVTDGVMLVGWSQGGYFLAKYLAENQLTVKVSKLFMIGAPAGVIEDWGGDNPAWEFGLAALRARLESGGVATYIFHAEDDPIVPFAHAETYLQALPQATLVSFTDKGHFLVSELPELIELLRSA